MSGSEAASGDPGDASPEPPDPDVSEPAVLALVVGGLEPAIVEMSAAGSFGPATAMMLPADDQHPACVLDASQGDPRGALDRPTNGGVGLVQIA